MASNIILLSNTNYLVANSPFVKDSSSKDVLRLVYFHLCAHDLIQLASVNRHLYSQIYSDFSLWDFLLQKCFPNLYVDRQLEDKDSLKIYKHLTTVCNNMTAGIYHLQTLRGHKDPIGRILMHEGKLISASCNNTIMIRDFGFPF